MPQSATHARIVLTTAANREEADRIAHALVEEHLAACATIVPGVESVYQWQGRIESSSEFLLLLKTTEERVTALKARLHRLHSYEIPEFLVLTVESGSAAYLAWLKASTVEGQ